MATTDQTFTRPTKPQDSENQYTGILLKVLYPDRMGEFEVFFQSPIFTGGSLAMNPSWAAEPVAGRADPMYRYESFSRELSIGFLLPAHNATEHDHNYLMLNRLAAATGPVYDDPSKPRGYNGCHIRYYIGGGPYSHRFLQGYGILSSVNFSWDERAAWHTALAPVRRNASQVLYDQGTAPQYTNVQLTITVLSNAVDGKRPALKNGDDLKLESFYLKKYTGTTVS